jgi:S1-C subfamily serine protease
MTVPASFATEPAEALLLSTARISTFDGPRALTNASGFFFERDHGLFLVTSRHVLVDPPTNHYPDRIEIALHLDTVDLTRRTVMSMLLYKDGRSCWRQGVDSGGEVDVAVLEIDRSQWPEGTSVRAFNTQNLQGTQPGVSVGAPVSIVGYPLGFHDTLHGLPIVRQAAVASAYGVRFQGKGFFLTDARMHRGASGSPVVMRATQDAGGALPWKLLGVHSSQLDMRPRDPDEDEALGLNSAWYADILLILTEQAKTEEKKS